MPSFKNLSFKTSFIYSCAGYTRHSIDSLDTGIIVELGTISIINHIKILLWDKDTRSYSYYVEVSVNQEQWDRVVDYSTYHCRSWQFLYFPSRAVRYIKLVGTHNSVNKVCLSISFVIESALFVIFAFPGVPCSGARGNVYSQCTKTC